MTEQLFSPDTQVEHQNKSSHGWSALWERMLRWGLGESILHIGTILAVIVLVLVVAWVMRRFYLNQPPTGTNQVSAAPLEAATPTASPKPITAAGGEDTLRGITRLADMHTVLPARPRFDISMYTVVAGDTLFGIAEKFGLKPETLMWGNSDILGDDPHRLTPGQQLRILPVDGAYYQWHTGDGLNGVAKYFHVSVDDILNWPGNNLSKESVGDYAAPNIKVDTGLVIPGGMRDYVTWTGIRISRDNPAAAKLLGPGACGTVYGGALGTGTFVWPSTEKWLSGYDYSPATNHFGIDVAGALGNPIFATDTGVVVYAGWNDWGYGNVVVIDHGGWQSLYAHLEYIYVSCGMSVFQGATIGAMGSTGNSSGPHLHFELMSDTYGRVNPWDFLTR